jgi:hypothetical protein
MPQSTPPIVGMPHQPPRKSNMTVIVIVIVACVLLVALTCGGLMFGLMMPALAKARATAQGLKAEVTMKELDLGLQSYLRTNGKIAPSAQDWDVALQPYMTSPLQPFGGYRFAMNASMGGVKMSDVSFPGRTVVFFEVAENSPHFGGAELLPSKPRNPQGHLVLMADGSVQYVPPAQVSELIWKP